MARWACALTIAVVVLLAGESSAKPCVPGGDGVVLERLPEKGDPSLIQLKRMRAALAANPRDLQIAVAVARRALEAARTLGDPRFLGQAQAALSPWWDATDIPRTVLLLRASLKQSQHDFEGSLADLDRLLTSDPMSAQARLARATVLAVRGRHGEARRDCEELRGHAAPIVVAGCDAGPASLSGDANHAYAALVVELTHGSGNDELREWALTLAAEIAARQGTFDAAERHFLAALALDPRDPYLKGAYADFLLDRSRPAEVHSLLRDETKNDGLLLRLALAEQRLPEAHEAFVAHRADLAERFEAARRRGDRTHRREEARFRLAIESDAGAARKLARDNWAVQREPADLRILIEAARAAGDQDALRIAADWIAATRLEDAAIAALMQASR